MGAFKGRVSKKGHEISLCGVLPMGGKKKQSKSERGDLNTQRQGYEIKSNLPKND